MPIWAERGWRGEFGYELELGVPMAGDHGGLALGWSWRRVLILL